MDPTTLYIWAADAILLLHVLFVLFIVVGLVLIFVGSAYRWAWIRNPWFRLLHLISIGVVALQSWFGILCPLTTLETSLRIKAGAVGYSGTFISHWLGVILYYEAPTWVFALVYTLFGVLVGASWFWVRPRPFRKDSIKRTQKAR